MGISGARARDIPTQRWVTVALVHVTVLATPTVAAACQPVVPLAMLFVSSHMLAGSMLGTLVVVALKCATFAHLERRRLPLRRAVVAMFVANLVTTMLGVLQAAAVAAPPLVIVLPAIIAASHLPARCLYHRGGFELFPWLRPWHVTLAAGLSLIATFVLLAVAERAATDSFAAYWIFKLGFVLAGLCFGIAVTTLWEEWVISLVCRRANGSNGETKTSYVETALQANLVALLLLMTVAAAATLPQRLQSSWFLLLR